MIVKQKYKYIKSNWDFKIEKSVYNNGFYKTTKNIVLNNNLLTEKQMNELQNIFLKKGGIVTLNDYEKEINDILGISLKKGGILILNDYNYNNDNPPTLEEW
jgi:hypothetical protein